MKLGINENVFTRLERYAMGTGTSIEEAGNYALADWLNTIGESRLEQMAENPDETKELFSEIEAWQPHIVN